MKTILFYGDSLVFGKKPGKPERYTRSENFIGVMENALGSEYKIIDEGLRARTLAGENSFFPERDGLSQFGAIYGSHVPLDLVVIMLGTNDCNKTSRKSDDAICSALVSYKEKVEMWSQQFMMQPAPLLIIAPPEIRGDQVLLDQAMNTIFGSDSEEFSKSLSSVYNKFCDEHNCHFFDASSVCKTADGEGIHLDGENNKLLGEALVKAIKGVGNNLN